MSHFAADAVDSSKLKLPKLPKRSVLALLLVLGASFAQAQSPAFWSWASRPVMGWNSWDFYGTSINEERTKAQADYMAANLLSHGWNLITVDIQWYQPTATGFTYIYGGPPITAQSSPS